MSIPESCWVVDLGQAEHLLPQLPCGPELSPIERKRHKALQHWQEPQRLLHALAQLARSVIGDFHLWGC
jgi:hypothetical protein